MNLGYIDAMTLGLKYVKKSKSVLFPWVFDYVHGC